MSVLILSLLCVAPTTALAAQPPFWGVWAKQVWKRELRAEVPFAVLVSLPAMLICTPVWAANVAIAKARGDD